MVLRPFVPLCPWKEDTHTHLALDSIIFNCVSHRHSLHMIREAFTPYTLTRHCREESTFELTTGKCAALEKYIIAIMACAALCCSHSLFICYIIIIMSVRGIDANWSFSTLTICCCGRNDVSVIDFTFIE